MVDRSDSHLCAIRKSVQNVRAASKPAHGSPGPRIKVQQTRSTGRAVVKRDGRMIHSSRYFHVALTPYIYCLPPQNSSPFSIASHKNRDWSRSETKSPKSSKRICLMSESVGAVSGYNAELDDASPRSMVTAPLSKVLTNLTVNGPRWPSMLDRY